MHRLLIAILFVLPLNTWAAEKPVVMKHDVGRFQLIPVRYRGENLVQKTEYDVQAVLRVDTVTGRTWILFDTIIPDKNLGEVQSRYWFDIQEMEAVFNR